MVCRTLTNMSPCLGAEGVRGQTPPTPNTLQSPRKGNFREFESRSVFTSHESTMVVVSHHVMGVSDDSTKTAEIEETKCVTQSLSRPESRGLLVSAYCWFIHVYPQGWLSHRHCGHIHPLQCMKYIYEQIDFITPTLSGPSGCLQDVAPGSLVQARACISSLLSEAS